MAQPCNPAILGDKDIGTELETPPAGPNNLVEFEMASCYIGSRSRVELGLGDLTGPDHMELWHCTSVRWDKAQDPSNQALN